MSYCVNCGVELEKSIRKCPLCDTEVINPKEKNEPKVQPAFSDQAHIPESLPKKFVAYVISMVMLIPNIVCLLANAVFFNGEFWSLYIAATSLLLWVMFVFPFFTSKLKPYRMWAFDTLSVIFYVYFFFVMGTDTRTWYYDTALPIILIVSFMVFIYMLWVRKRERHIILKVLHLFIDFSLFSLFGGLIISVGLGIKIMGYIGIIVFISCLFIIAFLCYCYKSKSVRRYITKRFFT
ncbi:MAG: hypothetical protein ACI4GC_01745 [Acutalibacteraceae bacterium]